MRAEFRLEGRVVDEAGAPVASARVAVGDHTVTTSGDGTFVFDLPADQYTLTAHAADYYGGPIVVGPDDAGQPIEVRLQLGVTLVLHVHAERAPVADAVVAINRYRRTKTDATGTAILRGLPPRRLEVLIAARGWSDEILHLQVHRDPGGAIERYMKLRPGAEIEGVVIGRHGVPVSDVTVIVLPDPSGTTVFRAVSDQHGKWRLCAPAGRYRLFADDRDRRSGAEALESDGRTPHRWLELKLHSAARKRGEKGARLAGTVVDDRGQPASGVAITVQEPREAERIRYVHWHGLTDRRGRFVTSELRHPEHAIAAEWTSSDGQRCRSGRTDVRNGETNIELVLATGGTITGRVLLGGVPVPHFAVRLLEPGHTPRSTVAIGARDPDGRFTLHHVDPGSWRVAMIGPGTRVKVSGELAVANGEHLDIGDIELDPAQRVTGCVRDRNGAPIAGARVIVGRAVWTSENCTHLERAFAMHFEAMTGEDGTYSFEGIDAGEWRPPLIWAAHPILGTSLQRELSPTESAIDFVILGSGAIQGRVSGLRGGSPMILAIRADEPVDARMEHVQPDGTFRFDELPPGSYELRAEISSFQPMPVEVGDGQTTWVETTVADATVKLTVLVPRGSSGQFKIEPRPVRSWIAMVCGADERCVLEFVPPGDYRISLDGNTWRSIVIAPSPAEQEINLR